MRSKPSPALQVSEQIGKELRAIYDGVLHEPIPDRFRALIERLGEEAGSAAPDPRLASTLAPQPASSPTRLGPVERDAKKWKPVFRTNRALNF
ncbi:NepR family anti-sigma factor [Methylocystis bryophila]|uniref:Anti-sigma factor NepR domain-containing protein n=1 Tax=Methylocystis bryophila TaxID=655015 RepID=A0A1W6MUY4_9HYPH|nr:NepR family anti-sigma factor [Methylocystis bryophila]ARN81413.1 hypothetical protein B1812_10370 [Methylocystis bryophila]BDV37409.1 hypothetical protein DSM21852_06620 [Methylocystis bryophila]